MRVSFLILAFWVTFPSLIVILLTVSLTGRGVSLSMVVGCRGSGAGMVGVGRGWPATGFPVSRGERARNLIVLEGSRLHYICHIYCNWDGQER